MRQGQRGSAMVATVLAWTMFLVSLALAIDIGRVYLFREQLRTAADAGALAGAMQVQRMVRVVMPRQVWEDVYCDDPLGGPRYACDEELVGASAVDVSGLEDPVWTKKTFRDVNCGGDYVCADEAQWRVTCWLEPKGGDWDAPRKAARDMFLRNAAWGDEAVLTGFEVRYDQDRRARDFEVKVGAELTMPTQLIAALGVKKIPIALTAVGMQVRSGGDSPPCR
jgi:hypothetical protein